MVITLPTPFAIKSLVGCFILRMIFSLGPDFTMTMCAMAIVSLEFSNLLWRKKNFTFFYLFRWFSKAFIWSALWAIMEHSIGKIDILWQSCTLDGVSKGWILFLKKFWNNSWNSFILTIFLLHKNFKIPTLKIIFLLQTSTPNIVRQGIDDTCGLLDSLHQRPLRPPILSLGPLIWRHQPRRNSAQCHQ